jgi:prepilin-type N-terminal cleavage/methylation domain-containing protein
MKRQRGFTLIELLVVIAIIGILSAVVLASLNTARSKGNDAAIQSDLNAVQTQAELFYTEGNKYGASIDSEGTCQGGMFDDPTIKKAVAAADTANGSKSVGCYAMTTKYFVFAELTSAPNTYWCVNSAGVAKSVTTDSPVGMLIMCSL